MAILAGLLGVTLPAAFRWRDAAAVRAARDELAGGLATTRAVAASHQGASLILDPAAGTFWIRARDGWESRPVHFRDRYRVEVDPGSTGPVLFHYDGLGIGRLTSRTIRLRRGRAEAGITVSAYGRYRQW